jgi:RHS repeat-associated protein
LTNTLAVSCHPKPRARCHSSGGLVSRYRYEPYGQQIGSPSGTPIPWRFAGQYLDTETGLYKMGLRYYDPSTMRWTQKDPLNLFQDPKQGNRYSYAGSDPVNNVDPTGLNYCT